MAHGPAEGGALRWADLRTRVVSAAVLAPLAVLIVWIGGIAWALLVILASAVLAFEWIAMCRTPPRAPAGLAVPLSLIATGLLAAAGEIRGALLIVTIGLGLACGLAVGRSAPRRRSASLAAGVVYIGLSAVAMIWLRQDDASGRANVLFLALIVWASDVGAYATGRLVGGPRLAPRISPGKTWSGAAGGLLAAVGVGYGAALWIANPAGNPLPLGRVALVSAALAMVAQLGDLLESALKRRFGVKDSGRLIPGHGGLLDRLDGFLAASPTAALLALIRRAQPPAVAVTPLLQ